MNPFGRWRHLTTLDNDESFHYSVFKKKKKTEEKRREQSGREEEQQQLERNTLFS